MSLKKKDGSIITRDQILEHKPHKYSAEASELGFPPGKWPKKIETDMGNGQPFNLKYVDEAGALYFQQFGCILLRVFND